MKTKMIRMNTCPQYYYSTKQHKVRTDHMPLQLVYGLLPLLRTKSLLPSRPRENIDPTLVQY
jgi:hypothetical protein